MLVQRLLGLMRQGLQVENDLLHRAREGIRRFILVVGIHDEAVVSTESDIGSLSLRKSLQIGLNIFLYLIPSIDSGMALAQGICL
jgi:hypothetical protein